VCTSDSVNSVHLAEVFTRHVDQHPEQLHKEWLDVAYEAAVKAYPCS
jgi:hypothetical protein